MIEEPGLSAGQIAFRLGVALLLVAANGFFVAAEFSLVGARRSRIETLAEQGNRRARLASHAIRHLDHYISGTQLGITLASLGLGWVGESTLSVVLIQVFHGLPSPYDVIATHAVAGTIAFAFITVLHIVLGELAPKSLALLMPEATSLWTSGPLIAFSRLFTPFIWFLNGAANLILRALGLRAPTEVERVHRPEEIELLLTQSYEHGLLSEEPVEMIRGVFDLSETSAAAVMTPRTEVEALPVTLTLEQAAVRVLESGHSRLPVYRDSIDDILGVVMARDIWRAQREGRDGTLAELIRPVPFVPDTKPLEGLLRQLQEAHVHIAVVVDEFGGTAGIVTIEDLLEEIVGEIEDEYDEGPPDIDERPDGDVHLSGTVAVAEVNERYDLALPEEDYTTVAGFVMGKLGRVAQAGDQVAFDGGRLRVLAMEGRRVERLALSFPQGPPEAADGADS